VNDSVHDGWKEVKLRDVADEISNWIDNPFKSGFNRFVGLEHLENGELTVRRWASTADLLSSMKLFKSGDILIGRRNAYLRRASEAEFDGICSGDAYVVREKSKIIENRFLPIVISSNPFWEYAIAHASGTMSKRARWRDLAEYTFLLPSREEQRQISSIIWAAEDSIMKREYFLRKVFHLKQVLTRNIFKNGIGHETISDNQQDLVPKGWCVKSIGECCESSAYGPRFSSELYDDDGNIAVLRTTDMDIEGNISYSTMPKSKIPPEKFQEHYLKKDDLVISRSGTCGITGVFSDYSIPVLPGAFLIRFRLDQSIDVKFLKYYLNSEFGQKRIKQLECGGVLKNLRGTSILDFKIPFPPLPEQRQIAGILTRCDETIAAARANVVAAKALKMKMINEMLSPV
jgi:type I restriction enzyme, S subunit